MCFKNKNKEICSHHWVHNAGKQCKWDCFNFEKSYRGYTPENYKKDSKNIAYMYICTMCGEEFWSSSKALDIPHYRVREVKK